MLLQSQDYFADIDNFGRTVSADALEEYLAAPSLSGVDDPIQWWSAMLNGGQNVLARMALDFLSAPGMSHYN